MTAVRTVSGSVCCTGRFSTRRARSTTEDHEGFRRWRLGRRPGTVRNFRALRAESGAERVAQHRSSPWPFVVLRVLRVESAEANASRSHPFREGSYPQHKPDHQHSTPPVPFPSGRPGAGHPVPGIGRSAAKALCFPAADTADAGVIWTVSSSGPMKTRHVASGIDQ
jgi:hypothetical protein